MKYSYKIIVILVLFLALFFVAIPDSWANPELVPSNHKENGDYTLNDFVLLAVNIASWVLLLSGSLALLAFVVGGFMFIFSAGRPDWVNKGKQALLGAAIGLAVVFLAYTGINYFMKSMGYDSDAFGGTWYQTPNR